MSLRPGLSVILTFVLCLVGRSCFASDLTRAQIERRLTQSKDAAADFSNLDLSGADLSGLDLHGADFFSSKLPGAKLKGARLASANFTRSDVQNADFSRADLRGATFYAALLDGADFTGADMTRARIIGGGRGVKFVKAKLIDADLGADPANQGMVPCVPNSRRRVSRAPI